MHYAHVSRLTIINLTTEVNSLDSTVLLYKLNILLVCELDTETHNQL